jgi:hypothetical protein
MRRGHCDASLAWRSSSSGCSMQDLAAAGDLPLVLFYKK